MVQRHSSSASGDGATEAQLPGAFFCWAKRETIIRLDIRGALEEAGYEVCAEARHGVEAVELARSSEPDIAVLDVKMPHLDGIEAARRILEHRSLPILDITDVQHSLRLRDGMIVLWGRPATAPEPAMVTG